MITIVYAPAFVRMYKKLNPHLREEVRERIVLLQNEENHPKLKVHKLQNIENTYSFSINFKIRVVFEYENNTTVNLLMVGNHDKVY